MRKMLFHRVFRVCIPALAAVMFAGVAGCKQKGYGSPQNYELDKPQRKLIGKMLNEVSGITYRDADSTLLAISDSKERIYQLDIKHGKLADYTGKLVANNSDMEDLVKVDSVIFLLQSSGVLKEIKDGATDTTGMKTYSLNLAGSNDFETVYYDASAKGLVLLCKSCAAEKGAGIRNAYRFDLASRTFDSTVFYTISKQEVKDLLKDNDAKFDPSAAAINPIDKRLYILSSAGNLLVVTDGRSKVIETYRLNPDFFPQAEGITFAPNGSMYISNEGKYGKPTLLIFPYQLNGKN